MQPQPSPTPQPLPQPTPQPKQPWTPPLLQKTPIAETAGTKVNAIGDGLEAFSS